jgi:hypothetical protein
MATAIHWMSPEGSTAKLFPFLTLNGSLVHWRPTFDREVRTGVNGVGIWATGKRGEPFGMSTVLDCNSVAAAGTAFAAYQAAIGTKKDLYYCGAKWGTILIHNVILTEVRKLTTRVGGIQNATGQSGAMLYAQWTIETLFST